MTVLSEILLIYSYAVSNYLIFYMSSSLTPLDLVSQPKYPYHLLLYLHTIINYEGMNYIDVLCYYYALI